MDKSEDLRTNQATVDTFEKDSPTGEMVDNSEDCLLRLESLLDDPDLSDMRLHVSDKTFNVHRLILAKSSDVFRALMMNQRFNEANQSEIVLNEKDDCVPLFGDFLRYLYTGKVVMTISKAVPLMILADKYQISSLKCCCTEFMLDKVNNGLAGDCVISWYQYAKHYGYTELQLRCADYIVWNMDTIVETEDWQDLQLDGLVDLLKRSDMMVSGEYELFQAICRWLLDPRKINAIVQNLVHIVPFIRFPLFVPERFAIVEQEPIVKEHAVIFQQSLLDMYKFNATPREYRHGDAFAFPNDETRFRNYRNDYRVSYCVEVPSFASVSHYFKFDYKLTTVKSGSNADALTRCQWEIQFYPKGYQTIASYPHKNVNSVKMVLFGLQIAQNIDIHCLVDVFVRRRSGNGDIFHERVVTNECVFNQKYSTLILEKFLDWTDLTGNRTSSYVVENCLQLLVFIKPVNIASNLPISADNTVRASRLTSSAIA